MPWPSCRYSSSRLRKCPFHWRKRTTPRSLPCRDGHAVAGKERINPSNRVLYAGVLVAGETAVGGVVDVQENIDAEQLAPALRGVR